MTDTVAGAAREARRTAIILAASQAIIGSAAPIAISMGGLAGQYLLGPDKSLATAPVTGADPDMVNAALNALRGEVSKPEDVKRDIVLKVGGK